MEGPNITGLQLAAYVFAVLLGLAAGALFSPKLRAFRKLLFLALPFIVAVVSLIAPLPVNLVLSLVAVFLLFVFAFGIAVAWGRRGAGGGPSSTFGSAKWATAALLRERRMIGEQGLALGYFPGESLLPLHYTGDRHLLTVAPTRAGKGVSAIVPNLLSYGGSALVIDPKGENAMTTALRRGAGDRARGIEGMGQIVHIVDPWGLTAELTGLPAARFNPLDWLDPASPEIGENAMMLADSLVMPAGGGNRDPFWDEEAKALLMGFILHVATSPREAATRTLGRVRDILMLPVADFDEVLEDMLNSPNEIVASAAARTAGKDPKLKANVISSAQAHTHFLDSPRLRESLSRSDFKFEDLKRGPVTIYLVLPADRLDAFSRWLRLLIQQAITVTARTITERPERPILFLLDEMAALGRLTMVEQAYGLMAGFGMQLWGIVQDLSQLHRIYGDGWQTFIGNSGVLQYFGSRDKMTAEYFSALCGEATVPTLSSSITKAFSSGQGGSSSSESTSHNHGETQRKLILPDELMRVASNVQLVLVENLDPIAGRKIEWFSDPRFQRHGVNLRQATMPPAMPANQPPRRMAAE
jgi:type IV secretion system protein VirD4